MSTTDSVSDGDRASSDDVELDENVYGLIAGGSAVLYVVAFTVVGELALESMVYGAIAGVFAGVGSYLFLPWFFGISALQGDDGDEMGFREAARQVNRSTDLGVLGLGLELGAILMLAAGFAVTEPDYVLGIGAALVPAVVIFAVGSALLD